MSRVMGGVISTVVMVYCDWGFMRARMHLKTPHTHSDPTPSILKVPCRGGVRSAVGGITSLFHDFVVLLALQGTIHDRNRPKSAEHRYS